mmetsp:Transcript_33408/g.79204  ORF Transcript_33408/g.79204 Transcript_33408/m.79204 type:complete len:209 (-) Transcript_33408:540-1166(-)
MKPCKCLLALSLFGYRTRTRRFELLVGKETRKQWKGFSDQFRGDGIGGFRPCSSQDSPACLVSDPAAQKSQRIWDSLSATTSGKCRFTTLPLGGGAFYPGSRGSSRPVSARSWPRRRSGGGLSCSGGSSTRASRTARLRLSTSAPSTRGCRPLFTHASSLGRTRCCGCCSRGGARSSPQTSATIPPAAGQWCSTPPTAAAARRSTSPC